MSFLKGIAARFAREVFLIALFVNTLGDWLYIVIVNALVLDPMHIALLGSIYAAVMLAGGFLAAAYIERYSVRTILIWANVLSAIVAAALGWSIGKWGFAIYFIAISNTLLGFFTAFMLPANEVYFKESGVEEQRYKRVWLKESQYQVGRVIGGAIIALTFIHGTFSTAFYLDALTFVVMVIALLLLPRGAAAVPHQQPLKERLKEGFAYVGQNRPLFLLNLALIVVISFGFSIFFFAPTLLGSPERYGIVMVAAGAGFVLGCFVSYSLLDLFPQHTKLIFQISIIAGPLPIILMVYAAPNLGLMALGYGLGNFIESTATVAIRYTTQGDKRAGVFFSVMMVVDRATLYVARIILAWIASYSRIGIKGAIIIGVIVSISINIYLLFRNRGEVADFVVRSLANKNLKKQVTL